MLWAGYVATTALYASAFGHYTATLLPGGTHPDEMVLRILIVLGIFVPWMLNLGNAALVARSEGIVVGIKLLIFVAYEGFELIANVSADVREPQRTIPLAFAAEGELPAQSF